MVMVYQTKTRASTDCFFIQLFMTSNAKCCWSFLMDVLPFVFYIPSIIIKE